MHALKRRWKLWWIWQEEEHERWLEQQSRAGWHLESIGWAGMLHRFRKGEPDDICYRWDVPERSKDAHYDQLFEDAGWRRVARTVGWHCWAKTRLPGEAVEIFTDIPSLRRKHRVIQQQLLIILLGGIPLLAMQMSSSGLWEDLTQGGPVAVAGWVIFGLYLSVALSSVVGTVRMWQRIRDLPA